MEEQMTKRRRGRGVKPALVHVNVRVPPWVLDFYKERSSYTKAMREVLVTYALDHAQKNVVNQEEK